MRITLHYQSPSNNLWGYVSTTFYKQYFENFQGDFNLMQQNKYQRLATALSQRIFRENNN